MRCCHLQYSPPRGYDRTLTSIAILRYLRTSRHSHYCKRYITYQAYPIVRRQATAAATTSRSRPESMNQARYSSCRDHRCASFLFWAHVGRGSVRGPCRNEYRKRCTAFWTNQQVRTPAGSHHGALSRWGGCPARRSVVSGALEPGWPQGTHADTHGL